MTASEQLILETIQTLKDDILDFSAELVSHPSTLGNETSVLELMEKKLGELSLSPKQVPIDSEALSEYPEFAPVHWDYKDRYNVVAERKRDGDGGKSALFNGHLDVVSAEPADMWERDPFSPFVSDGWLYGRGSGDMKSGVSAMIYALHAIEKAGLGLRGDVTIETVIEEECTGNGAFACRKAGYGADAVLIPEPFSHYILTHQVGVLWFRVILQGEPVHVLSATSGVNAILKCYPLITALQELETEMNREKHPAFDAYEHPINLNVGIIKGGDWPSTVPPSAEFHCRLAYYPGQTFQEVRDTINRTIEAAAKKDEWLAENPPTVEFYGFRSDGHALDMNQPFFQTLQGCHHEILQTEAHGFMATSTTDVRSFVLHGHEQVTCYGPVAENIHGFNERVQVDSILDTAKVYALFLARWCGLKS